jgi:hypothetical protein
VNLLDLLIRARYSKIDINITADNIALKRKEMSLYIKKVKSKAIPVTGLGGL